MHHNKIPALALCLLLCLCLLAGCGQRRAEEGPAAPELSAPAAEPTPEPTPTPEPPLPPGEELTVNGVSLPGGSVLYEGAQYVSLREFAAALNLELEESGEGFAAQWRGRELRGAEGGAELYLDDQPAALGSPLIRYRGELYLPVRPACEAMGISVFYDQELAHWYFTPAAGSWTLPEGYRVPVFMYHAVTDEVWGIRDLFFSPADMEEQLRYLVDNGYQPIWFEDLEHIELYDKPVILTFDDGYMDNYTELYPLLEKYQVKATFFIITGWLGGDVFMTPEIVGELSRSGLVSVQSHTHSHPQLDKLSREEQEQEMALSKLLVTRMTGKEPFVVCYPEGRSNQTTLELATTYYRFGVKMTGPTYRTGDEASLVYRVYVSRGMSLASFVSQLEA